MSEVQEIKEGYKESPLGLIPEDWEVKSIGKLFEFVQTKSLSRSQLTDVDTGVSYVHYGDIHSTFRYPIFDLSKGQLPFVKDEIDGDFNCLKDGDLIIADASEDLEGVAKSVEIVGIDDREVVGGLHTIVCRDKQGLTCIGIKPYLLLNPAVDKSLKRIATGASVLGLSKGNLIKINLAIPPLPEQKKIADILTAVDDKIEAIDQRIKTTQTLKKGLMQRLLTKGIKHTEFKDSPLGEIPVSWEVVKLVDVCEKINVGFVGTCERFYCSKDDGVLMIRTGNLHNGKLRLSDVKYVSYEFHEKNKKSQLVDGDLMIARHGSSGQAVLYDAKIGEANCLNIVMVRPKKESVDTKFLLYYFNSDLVISQVRQRTAGSTQGVVNTGEISSLLFLIPKEQEQKRIADILTSVDDKIDVLQEKKLTYQTLKKGLMQQLLTGKKRVKV